VLLTPDNTKTMAKYGLNQVTLIGNLGKDPEMRRFDGDVALATLRIACTERRRDKTGNYLDYTEWVTVNLWRGQAEIAEKYLRKGSTVCIEGKISTRSWETPEGEKRSITEVEGRRLVLLDSAPPSASPASQPVSQVSTGNSSGGFSQQQPPASPASGGTQPDSTPAQPETQGEDTDDLPF
jgi:single-strand DNA-binding protein